MKSFFTLVLAILTTFLILILLFVIILAVSTSDTPSIKKHSFLVINIDGGLPEYAEPEDLQSKIMGESPESLQRILSNLEKAKVDERIDGVIFRIHGDGLGYAMMEEIRAAIDSCQNAGKTIYAYATSMSRNSMYLAAACDSIFMPPAGYFSFHGFASEKFYIKNALKKIGVKFNLHKIKEYKTAAEIIQEEKMTDENREMTGWILDEIWENYLTQVATDRNLSAEALIKNMEKGSLLVAEALTEKLIDDIRYWDDFVDSLKQPDDKKLRQVSQASYSAVDPDELNLTGDKKIAVIHAQGTIGGRKSGLNPLLGQMMGYESVAANLRAAQQDEDVAAVVFRVNSGGGDHLTSDLISHQVELLAQKKPVVISMVDVAASGGYSISYRGTKLVANENTVTGSIGSITATVNMKELYHKLGITKDYVTKGPNALYGSDYVDFTDTQWQHFTENHWQSYNAWVEDIAKFRKISVEALDRLARGRVWTGEQAKANGLIDEIGGLERAIQIAKELAEIPATEKVTQEHYPKAISLPEMIFSGNVTQADLINGMLYYYFQVEIPRTLRFLTHSRLMILEPAIIN
jgi:protease-4